MLSPVMSIRRQKSIAYQTIGRFAMGKRALGFWSGLFVNVGNDDPGPHRMMAWNGIVSASSDMVTVCVCMTMDFGYMIYIPEMSTWLRLLAASFESRLKCEMRLDCCPKF